MKSSHQLATLLAAVGLLALSACAQIKALPNLPSTHPEELASGPVSCAECHEDQQKGTMKAFKAFNHSRVFIDNHRFYAATDQAVCATCHKDSFCADCHTTKAVANPATVYGNRPDRRMPHRGNFLTQHKIEGKYDRASCDRCHGRGNNERCLACHR